MTRAGSEEPNCSLPPRVADERFTAVRITRCAFLENQSVRHMTMPDPARMTVGVCVMFLKPPIVITSGSAPG